MSSELIAIIVVAVYQTAILLALGVMISRMSTKQIADDAALYLQGEQIKKGLREVHEDLLKNA
jgi:hypothetical protein